MRKKFNKVNIINEIIHDYEKCYSNQGNISDTWKITGSQNLENIEKNLTEDLLLNPDIKGLISIDGYTSLIPFLNSAGNHFQIILNKK